MAIHHPLEYRHQMIGVNVCRRALLNLVGVSVISAIVVAPICLETKFKPFTTVYQERINQSHAIIVSDMPLSSPHHATISLRTYERL